MWLGEIQIKSHSQFRAIFVNQWDDSDSTADDSWWSKRARAFDSVCLERRRREISRSLSFFSDFWKYLNSNYNESIASNIIMKQFSETTKIKTTLILSTRTQLSDISSVQMKLFLVKLNFLNLKKVNIQNTKFNMVSKQQKYQYVFTPPPRCPRRSPRTTTIWRTRLAFPNNCRPGLLPQHLL